MPARLPTLALSLAALCASLAVAEGAVRFRLGDRLPAWTSVGQSAPIEGFYLLSRTTGTTTAPHFSGISAAKVPLYTDVHGLRIADPDQDRSQRGWLVLGDSFTAAIQVPAAQTFAGRLEAQLGMPMHNAGIDGTSTGVAAERARQLIPDLDLAGLLLVFYTGNDFEEEASRSRRMHFNRDLVDGAVFPIGPDRYRAIRFLLNHSVLAHLAIGTAEARMSTSPGPDSTPVQQLRIFHQTGAELLRRQTDPIRTALNQLHAQARRAGIPLVVAIAPPAYQVRPGVGAATFAHHGLDPSGAALDAPTAAVLRLAKEQQIPTCDLTPALVAAQEQGQDPYFLFDGHWSPSGHAVVAQRLAECLQAPGLLSAPPPTIEAAGPAPG